MVRMRLKKLKGDEAPFMIAIIIFAGALTFVFLTMGISYTKFQAEIDNNAAARMDAVDLLHLVRYCASKDTDGNSNGTVDEGRLGECKELWAGSGSYYEDFNVGIANPGSAPGGSYSIYVATAAHAVKELYAKK